MDSSWLFVGQNGKEQYTYRAYYGQGVYYLYRENYDSAIYYLLNALKLQPKIRDTIFYENAYSLLSDLNDIKGNHNATLYYYQPVIEKAIKAQNENSVLIYINGFYYASKVPSKDSLANSYLSKAIEIAQKINYDKMNASIFYCESIKYIKANKYDSSIYYAKKAIERIDSQPHPIDRIEKPYVILLENYIKKEQYNNAIMELQIAKQKINFETIWDDDKINLLEKEWFLCDKTSQLNKAYALLKEINSYKIENNEKENAILLQNHEKELKRLSAENVIKSKDIEIQKKKNLNDFLLFLCISFLIFLSIIFQYLKKRKELEKLEQEKIAIELKLEKEKAEISIQIEERNRISQEIHDDLGSSLTTVQMGLALLKKEPTNELHLKIVENATQTLNIQINEVIWNLNVQNDYVFSLIDFFTVYGQDFLSKADIKIEVTDRNIPNDLFINGKLRKGIYLTLKELLNNIVKYAQARKVEVHFELKDQMLFIRIKDDGTGVSDDKLIENIKIKGNGIKNIKQTISKLKGTVVWNNNNGTETIINLPIQ